jgi:uncharacterized radical SAM superfamily protein
MEELKYRMEKARQNSHNRHGKKITFFLPGMFSLDGFTGKYPAVSITGNRCELHCDHCKGTLLHSMIHSDTPEQLVSKCLYLWEKGTVGVLISGGCDRMGRLPWKEFIPAIEEIKKKTGLFVSVHSGIVDAATALCLKDAGVDQALIDIIGDDETYQAIYHVDFGTSKIVDSLEHLCKAGLPVIPHVVCGLYYGRMRGEKEAVKIISRYDVDHVVIVSLMNLPGPGGTHFDLPAAEDITDIIVETRERIPGAEISLGCARQRGNTRIEIMAIEAGVNRMAIPSDEAIALAEKSGLEIMYQSTCCSVPTDQSEKTWIQE